MSHVEINEQKKGFEKKYTEKQQNDWVVIDEEKKALKGNEEKVPERINAATAIESQDYLERMINNSKDQNLKLKVRQEETLEKENWANVVFAKGYPLQKLPVAVKDRKFGSSEEDAVKEAKKYYANADLCTVREKARMTEYFMTWKKGQAPEPEGEDDPKNRSLNDYVKSILKVELGNAHFSDDYLSQHIHELYDYSIKLSQYSSLKEKYPKYFSNLSLEKQMALESAAEMGPALTEILTKHMDLHGIVLEDMQDGVQVILRNEPKEKNARQAERDRKKREYDAALKEFYSDQIIEKELRLGEKLSEDGAFDSASTIAALEERINSNEELKELFPSEIATVLDEVRKSLSVRDELIERQKGFVREYRESTDKNKKNDARLSIKRMNSRILLASKHADNYRAFIRFIMGDINRLPAETAEFFLAENHADLVEVIDFKMSADFVNDSLVLEEVVEKERALKKLKSEKTKKDSKKKGGSNADEKIAKLEKEIKEKAVYAKIPLSSYYGMFREYRKMSESNKAAAIKNEEINKRKETASNEGDKLAAKYGLVPRNLDRVWFSLNGSFRDMDTEGDGGDLTYMYLASKYKPGPATTREQKKLIVEKGIMPIVNRMLSKSGKDIKNMDFNGYPDFNDPEFWENNALVNLSFIYDSGFMPLLKDYDVSLKDEEYDHIIAFSRVAQELRYKYNSIAGGETDPKLLIFNNEKISYQKMTSLIFNVYQDFLDNSANITPEMNKVRERYSKKKLGFDNATKDKMGNTVRVPIVNFMSNLAQLKMGEQIGAVKDPEEEFDKELKKVQSIDKESEEREAERKEMLAYFPQYGEKELDIRIMLKNYERDLNRRTTNSEIAKWKKALGDSSDNGADLRSFKIFLKPIKISKSGSTHPDSLKDREFNERMIDDYISGDEKRRNKVLYRISKELLNIKITPEMLNPDYVKEHFIELHGMLQKVHGFQNILAEYPDFFESDVFTEKEKDYIRQNFTDGETVSMLTAALGNVARLFGITDSGKPLNITPEEKKTKESRENWGRKQIAAMEPLIAFNFEDKDGGVAAAYERDERHKALYETKGDLIRKVSKIHAKLKAERAALIRRKNKEIDEIDDTLGKAEKDKEKTAIDLSYNEQLSNLQSDINAASNLKKYIYEDVKEASADARLLAYQYGLGLFSNDEVNDARVDLDMSYDMDLDEQEYVTVTEEENREEEVEKALKLRKQWETEIAEEDGIKDFVYKEPEKVIEKEAVEKEKPEEEKPVEKEKPEEEKPLEKEKTEEKEPEIKEKTEEEKAVEKEKPEEKEPQIKEKSPEEEKRERERYEIEHTDISKLNDKEIEAFRERERVEAEKLYNEAMKKREEEGKLDSDEPLFIFNGKKYINPNTPVVLREIAEGVEMSKKKYLTEDYPDNTRIEMEKVLRDAGFVIPEDKEDFSDIMSEHCETVYWLENGAMKTESIWKKSVTKEVRDAYNWLRGYYRANDMGVRLDEDNVPTLEMPKYKVKVDLLKQLREKQGYNNCWCCAGAAIYNMMYINKQVAESKKNGKKKTEIDGNKLAGQYEIRGYKAEYKDYDELNAKFKGKVDKFLFDADMKKTKAYIGEGKKKIGSIFEIGDYFLDKADKQDFILNRMIFNIPNMKDSKNIERNTKIYNNMKVNFLEQVKEILDTGNPVACLSHNSGGLAHYRTITGINGENITYYDSATGKEETGSWETFLNTVSHIPTELTWFSPMQKPEELTAEYSNLTYDKEKGFDIKHFRAEGALNVAQTKGVCVGADVRKMKPGTHGIEKVIYIPKNV